MWWCRDVKDHTILAIAFATVQMPPKSLLPYLREHSLSHTSDIPTIAEQFDHFSCYFLCFRGGRKRSRIQVVVVFWTESRRKEGRSACLPFDVVLSPRRGRRGDSPIRPRRKQCQYCPHTYFSQKWSLAIAAGTHSPVSQHHE